MKTQRAHSKFAASGMERWSICTASVEASEGLPDIDSKWSLEGTKAHKLLELALNGLMPFLFSYGVPAYIMHPLDEDYPEEMKTYATEAALFIFRMGRKLNAQVLVETRVFLDFIHPEMFGTFDGAILDHFGTLHVFDFKYGAGHAVSPVKNLQMIFYGIGLAHQYDWNFKRARLWIIQPRIRGYDGPIFWDISIDELRSYVQLFKDAVRRVKDEPKFVEGSHCHWCKAKSVCPLKTGKRRDKIINMFKQ